MLHTHELPAAEAARSIIAPPGSGEDAHNALWARELDLNVASAGVVNPDLDGNVLEPLEVSRLERVGRHAVRVRNALGCDELASSVLGRNNRLDVTLNPSLRFDELPVLSELDKLAGIELTVTVFSREQWKTVTSEQTLERQVSPGGKRTLVIELSASGGCLPVGIDVVECVDAANHEVLNIAPGEIGSDLESERDHADSERGCGRSASVTVRALVLADVGCVNVVAAARAWSDSEDRGTSLRIVGM